MWPPFRDALLWPAKAYISTFLNDTEHLNVNNIVRWCLILVVVDLLRQVSTITGPLSTADIPLHKCAPVKIRSPMIWACHV